MLCRLLGLCNNPKIKPNNHIQQIIIQPVVPIPFKPPMSDPVDIPRKKKLINKP